MKISPRFKRLKLAAEDRAELLKMQRNRKPQTPQRWRRIRALLLLDRGYSIRATAAAIGGYHREVSRGQALPAGGGIERVLSDEPRPKPRPMLDRTQQAVLVALVCGPPPQGRAPWTVRLLAVEAGKRGVVDKVGRETVRVVLARHDLKPWREKMWCVPEIDPEFVARMEDVLELYSRPHRQREPVVCLDERPVQLLDSGRPDVPMQAGQHRRRDYEYVREGTANIFCIVEPLTGRRLTYASANRTGRAFTRALQRIARRHPAAKKIHLVMDNLSTHSLSSLTATLGAKQALHLWRLFQAYHTPKHASWLNVAEMEGQHGVTRMPGELPCRPLHTLKSRVAAWRARTEAEHRPIHWKFTVADARRVFRYERTITPRSEH